MEAVATQVEALEVILVSMAPGPSTTPASMVDHSREAPDPNSHGVTTTTTNGARQLRQLRAVPKPNSTVRVARRLLGRPPVQQPAKHPVRIALPFHQHTCARIM